ncbi:11635_t:CDS:2 [Rhizophagus irregularis]|nr:11635_t:CDS:2 [Rhizophagus irregularis]
MKTYKSSLNKFSQSKPTQHLASKKMEDHTCDQEVSTNKSRLSSELPVPDIIDYNLNVLFVGLFSGKKSIKERHHYSSSNNHFYYALYESGMTNGDHLTYLDDQRLARDYKIGIVTLASRPEHRSKTKLSFEEIKQEFPNLLEKVEKYRPKVLCFNGRAVFQAFAVFQNARISSSTKRKKIVSEDWSQQPNFSIRWNDRTDEDSNEESIKYIKREERHVIDTRIRGEGIDLINACFKEEFNNEQDDYEENDVEDTSPNKKCRLEQDYSPPKSFVAKRW